MTATATGLTTAQVQSLIQGTLAQHRAALQRVQALYAWTSGLQVADMATAAGLSTADATTYLSAVADANAEANYHYSGAPGGAYPAPTSDYVYGATQAQVIGPQV
jgi:hypothetical protein